MNQSQTAYLAAVSAMQRLIAKSKQSRSTSLKSYIVGLYTADDQNPLRFSGKIGMLQIDFDRQHKLHFLRFYDIQSLQLLMQVQLFYGFGQNYRKTGKDTLYIFDLFADGVIGFEFRNAQEAEIMALKIKSVAPKTQQFRQLIKDRIQKQIEQKKQSSFFGKLKKKLNNIVHEQQHHESSVVLKVQIKKSIKMNFQTGQFDMDNVPPEWEDLLAKAGVRKQDMKNKQVLKLVFEETLIHHAKKAAQQNPDLVDKKHLDMIKEQMDYDDSKTNSTNHSQNQLNQEQFKNNTNLPPPPIIGLKPPPLSTGPPRVSVNRNDLMAQIRNNNLKLKPVKATEKGVELDLSSMNKEERLDLADHIRIKLQMRKQALNRRKASDEQQDD